MRLKTTGLHFNDNDQAIFKTNTKNRKSLYIKNIHPKIPLLAPA